VILHVPPPSASTFPVVDAHRDRPGGSAARRLALAVTLALTACAPATEPAAAATPGEWVEFEGSWNAAGSRRALSLGADRRSAIIELRGTMLLTGAGRPGAGFHSEVIALTDSATGLTGRGVWTDEHGDEVFSELQGEGTSARNRISGKLLGGTGRYAGVEGSYEFSWQFVMEAEDGAIQGRAVELKGRVRLDPGAGGAPR
jgi:hypothetical protein